MNMSLAREMALNPIWDESSKSIYRFPLQTKKDMRRVGMQIGQYPTPEETMYPLELFMASEVQLHMLDQ